jgi:hypothetical protein
LLGATACSALLSPGELQCESATDCADRGFASAACVDNVCVEPTVVDPKWGCLGHVVEPWPDRTKKVPLEIRLVLAFDKSAVKTAVVDVCDKLDLQCAGTNPDYPKAVKPAADGMVKLSVVQGFDGFVRITDPTIVDTRVYVGRPLLDQPSFNEVRLLRPSDYEGIAAIAGLDVDPARGTAILAAVDCTGESVSGVRFKSPEADAKSTEFYLINQVPAKPPAAGSTDHDGFGGFFNLKPATALARAYRAKDDAFIGESSFQVLANTISFVLIRPSPG